MWRAHWTPPGSPFPTWVDFTTENAAHLFALRKSREERVEVAVIELEESSCPKE